MKEFENKLVCLVGPSGCGKTTTAATLEKKFDLKQIWSYCTRPKRFEGETGHIFVSDEDFPNQKDIISYNQYNGYQYGATYQQVEKNDIYVVDIPGLKDIRKNYKGSKKVIAIGLYCSPQVALSRMLGRGDSESDARKRITYDQKVFSELSDVVDIVIDTDKYSIDKISEQIKSFAGGY